MIPFFKLCSLYFSRKKNANTIFFPVFSYFFCLFPKKCTAFFTAFHKETYSLHFPLNIFEVLKGRICLKDQELLYLVIISFNLMTLICDLWVIL